MNAVGMAWYSPAAWAQLEAMPEARIEKTYGEFISAFKRAARGFEAQGIGVERVEIDVDRMAGWCHRNGYEIDTKGRAAYGAALLCDPSLSAPFIDNTRVLQ